MAAGRTQVSDQSLTEGCLQSTTCPALYHVPALYLYCAVIRLLFDAQTSFARKLDSMHLLIASTLSLLSSFASCKLQVCKLQACHLLCFAAGQGATGYQNPEVVVAVASITALQEVRQLQGTTDAPVGAGIPFLGTFTTSKESFNALTSSVQWDGELQKAFGTPVHNFL